MIQTLVKRTAHPELTVALASAVWGLLWLPLRAFNEQGLSPGWVIIGQFAAPLVVLIPLALWRSRHNQPTGIQQYATGLLFGGGVVLYSESILQTSVVRALILFYVMPAWGTLIEVGWMGRRFTIWRGLALVLSLSGLLAILGPTSSLDITFNLGDGMALLAGLIFTFGAQRVREAPQISVFEQIFAFFFFGSIVALGISLLPIAVLGRPPTAALVIALAPWMMLLALGVLLPVMSGIYWGSRFVDPGRLGIILQLEAVVGIGSAALLAGEPFGMRELIGSALVISAGVVEIFGNKRSEAHQ